MQNVDQIFLREATADDAAMTADVLNLAFGSVAEARLVGALRRDGAMALEIVATANDKIVGYAALSRFVAPSGWLCLAPVAVTPRMQHRGIGRRLVRDLLKTAQARGEFVVVLGDVTFYEGCGFSLARAARLCSPYPLSHTMLAGPGDTVPSEALVYPEAFSKAD